MTIQEFNDKYNAAFTKTNIPILEEDGIINMIKQYTNGQETYTQDQLAIMVFIESRKYTKELVYNVLREMLVLKD